MNILLSTYVSVLRVCVPVLFVYSTLSVAAWHALILLS